jgi:hypothetical protein
MNISHTHSCEAVNKTIIQVFEENKWKKVSGLGDVNYQYLRLGRRIDGPVVSAVLTDLAQNTQQLDFSLSANKE